MSRILINGAGIAGPYLACALRQRGFVPTLLEKSASLRQGGYMLDFWGVGWTCAERIGVMQALKERAVEVDRLQMLDERGGEQAYMDMDVARSALSNRFISLLRSDLANVICRKYCDDALALPIRFNESIRGIEQTSEKTSEKDDDDGVLVHFESGAPSERFDVVVGADGLHSVTRQLAFGELEDAMSLRDLGFIVASYSVGDLDARRDDGQPLFQTHSIPNRSAMLYSTSARDEGAIAFFIARVGEEPRHVGTVDEQKEVLRELFDSMSWRVPEMLERVDEAPDFWLDRVAQVTVPAWSKGRVVLVGDAAYCPSLLSGQGSSLAMAGAEILANELAAARDESTGRIVDCSGAFARYEQRLRKPIEAKQAMAVGIAKSFVPPTERAIAIRNAVLNLSNHLPVAVHRFFIRRFLQDDAIRL
jgi:2-polyprenyl-6-methoxyphenol hydroxylase-like FAD-dependent oxidoreductase